VLKIVRKISLCLVIFCLLVFPGKVRAQSSQNYYNELLQNYRGYQTLLDPYNTLKSRDLTHGTVSTQAELLAATQSLIDSMIKAIISYTNFVKVYLAEASSIFGLSQENLASQLNNEIEFLNSASPRAKNLSSLGDGGILLKEVKQHYTKISQLSYQVQSIVKYESVKKVHSNLKVEQEKLNSYLSQNTSENYQTLAAKEKFQLLNLEMKMIEQKISEIESTLKPPDEEDDEIDWKGTYLGINKKVKEIVVSFNKIVSGYQNIVFSLK
jgi:hypothetical protein